jgi:hypothetical protein
MTRIEGTDLIEEKSQEQHDNSQRRLIVKLHKPFIYLLIAASFLMITACGGGGGDSPGSGEL